MGKVRNVLFYLSMSLCCLCVLSVVRCKITSNNPADYESEQTKLTVTVPNDVDADIYRVSILIEGSDTIIYYENAKFKDIEVSVPSKVSSQIIVYAYKNSSTIFTGSAIVAAGNQKSIAIVRQEFAELLPPAEISGLVTADKTVSLSWTASSDATGYRIYRTTSPLELPVEVGYVSESSWTDTSVSIGTTYYYRIIAQNVTLESSPSVYAVVLITDQLQGTIPAAPANVNVIFEDNSSVKVTWDAVEGADTYNVYRKDSEGSASDSIGTVSSTRFVDSPVDPNTAAGYSISAVNKSGKSVLSDIKWLEIPQSAPQTPVGVIAKAASENKIKVTWDAVDLASEYKVQWSTKSSGPFESRNVTSNVLEVSSLLSSTAYFFNVFAINSFGQSAPSATVTCTTLNTVIAIPKAPSGVTGAGISENSIEITWTAVQNVTQYKVQWSTQSGGTFTSADVETNAYVIGSLIASTQYFCRVSAVNSSGQSEASSTITVKTLDPALQAPLAPVLIAAAQSDTSIQISWGPVSNAAFYIIERATISSGPFAAICTTASSSKTDIKLKSSTSYFYRGKAINSAGGSAYSPTVSATTSVTLLSPSGLSAGTITESSIIVKWVAATGAESYKIYSAVTESGTYQVMGTVTATQYTVSGLNSGATYYFKVSSIKGTLESALSSAFSATTSASILSVPGGLAATVVSSSSISINFNTVTGATGYIVYSGSSTSSLKAIDSVTTGPFVHSSLQAATTYYYAVAAINASSTSSISSSVNATTQSSALAVPTGLSATVVSSSSITFKYSAVTGVTGYIVYSGSSSSNLKAVDTITAVTFTHTGLTASTTYYYAVASMSAGGTSAISSTVNATTSTNAPVTPTGLTATVASASSITVKFTAVSGATGYKLYSSTNNSTFTLLSSLTATTYTQTGLTANTTYYYKISAVNGTVESAQSSSVSAITTVATKVAVIGASCNGCRKCLSSCKQNAIIKSGSKYVIDASKCDGCGKCVPACSKRAITLK